MIAYLIVVIILVAGTFAGFMRSFREEPEPETALCLDPARTAAGIALLIRMSQRPAPVLPRDRYEPTPVHRYARMARECPAGLITTRAARLAQAVIPHLEDWEYEYPTGQFAAICGVA